MTIARWGGTLSLALCSALAIFVVSLHLNDAIWQDEAYTLINFSMRGWQYPFIDYHLPNNHILLSSFMSYWWSPNDQLWHLRLPLFLSFIVGVLVFGYTVSHQFGRLTGLVAVIFYAFSSLTPHFALQLRGYGVSWVCVILLIWATPDFIRNGRFIAGLVYFFASAALVAFVPTNAIVSAVFVAWGFALMLDVERTETQRIKRFIFIAIMPMFGGIAYLAILPQLLMNSGHDFSEWGRLEIYEELLKILALEYWIFLPLMVLGAWASWRKFQQEHSHAEIGLLISVLMVPLVLLLLFKHALFPRSLVPLLPLFSLAGAFLVKHAVQFCRIETDGKGVAVILVLTAICMLTRFAGVDCSMVSDSARPGNLCGHYYHAEYRPKPLVDFLQTHRRDGRPIITSYESYYALGFINVNQGLRLDLIQYKNFPRVPAYLAPWIALGAADNLNDMLAVAPEARYVQVVDSGYFKLYKPVNISLPPVR